MQALPTSGSAPDEKPLLVFSHGLGATALQGRNFVWRRGFNKFEFFNVVTDECMDTGSRITRWVNTLVVFVIAIVNAIIWFIKTKMGLKPEPLQELCPFPLKSNIAQEGDIDSVLDSVLYLNKTRPDTPYALFGLSKGALATLRALAVLPTQEGKDCSTEPQPPFTKPRFILLDNCPDTIANVVYWRYGNLWGEVCLLLLSLFTKFDPLKDWPIKDYVDDLVALDVPIAFVVSRKDTSVPNDCTYRIMDALASTNLDKKIHVLTLQNAGHNVYNTASPAEWDAYCQFIDGLYETYCNFK